jgi:hypothetical protein
MSNLARSAPAVLYPIGRSQLLGGLLLGSNALAAVVLGAWIHQKGGALWPWKGATAIGLWIAAIVGALHFWLTQFRGAIRWDGQGWALIGLPPDGDVQALSGPPEVFLDLQTHLWVRAGRAAGTHRCTWHWLERSAQPERWMDMRRAVYSRAKPGVGPDASAPADSRGA